MPPPPPSSQVSNLAATFSILTQYVNESNVYCNWIVSLCNCVCICHKFNTSRYLFLFKFILITPLPKATYLQPFQYPLSTFESDVYCDWIVSLCNCICICDKFNTSRNLFLFKLPIAMFTVIGYFHYALGQDSLEVQHIPVTFHFSCQYIPTPPLFSSPPKFQTYPQPLPTLPPGIKLNPNLFNTHSVRLKSDVYCNWMFSLCNSVCICHKLNTSL